MRVKVFKHDQNPATDQPAHKVSDVVAIEFLAYGDAVRVKTPDGKDAVQLKPGRTFQDTKEKHRPKPLLIPQLLPPRAPFGLLLFYPCKDQISGCYR